MKDIFLCHSKKDLQQALKLKSELENLGYSIWFDEEDILPGQMWELNIKNAIHESRVVIVCLSTNWVNEKSYAHKELRTALEIMEQLPENRIFIIPLKFDNCQIPDKLKGLQYIEIYKRGYLVKLQEALEKAIGKRDDDDEKKKFKNIKTEILDKNYIWLIIWLTVTCLVLNALGILKANIKDSDWVSIFWMPPLIICIGSLITNKILSSVLNNKLQTINFLWWIAVFLLILVNQYMQQFYHIILIGALFLIAVIGQVAFSTRLICLGVKTEALDLRYLRYINISRLNLNLALITYIVGLGFAGLIAIFIWFIPGESLYDLYNKTNGYSIKSYRINWTIEILIAYFLASIGYWRLIYRPLKDINII